MHSRIVLGVLSMTLSLSSIAYHASHVPCVRAVDVTLLYSVSAIGTTGVVEHMILYGPSVHCVLAMTCVLMLVCILVVPIFHKVRGSRRYIGLRSHCVVHVLGGMGLYNLALMDGEVTKKNIDWLAWSIAFVMLLIAVSLSFTLEHYCRNAESTSKRTPDCFDSSGSHTKFFGQRVNTAAPHHLLQVSNDGPRKNFPG